MQHKISTLLIDIIAGARPNFMKIAPIIEAIKWAKKSGKNIGFRLIHTGQHYDRNMSDNFFEQLGIPHPDINLGAGGGTQAEQTAAIMVGFEKVLIEKPSDLCLEVRDVNYPYLSKKKSFFVLLYQTSDNEICRCKK